MLDLLTILPWYVEVLLSSLLGAENSGASKIFSTMRVLRLARVMRVFRLVKYSRWMQIFAKGLRNSSDALICLAVCLTITCVVFGAVIFEVEREARHQELHEASEQGRRQETEDGAWHHG